MKINKQQSLNTTYNKSFKFIFYPAPEQIALLEHYFGSARFVFYHTLSYSINHYVQKALSRKVKGSKNRNKQRVKLARLYAKKENKVNDFYHKISSTIVNENQMIVVEDLNFTSMKTIDNENAALNLYHYDEDKANKVIQDVLTYHKNKVNHLPEKVHNPGKLKLNNRLLFNVN